MVGRPDRFRRAARKCAIWFEYDGLNRLTAKRADTQYTGPMLAEYEYDQGTSGIGRRTGMTAYEVVGGTSTFQNKTEWTYNERGRPVNELHNFGAGVDYNFGYVYTEGDLLSAIKYPKNDGGSYGEYVATKYWWPAGTGAVTRQNRGNQSRKHIISIDRMLK